MGKRLGKRDGDMEEKRCREDREHKMRCSNARADVEALGKPLPYTFRVTVNSWVHTHT